MRRLAALLFAVVLLHGGAAFAQHEGTLEGPVEEAGERAESAAASATPHGAEHDTHAAPPVNWTDMGYGDKDVEGGTLDAGDTPMAPPFVLMIINFAVFAWLLFGKIPLGPVKVGFGLGHVLSRQFSAKHDTIKSSLEEAARLRAEAETKLEEYNQRIKDVDSEVAELIAQIRADAEAERARILAGAERQAELTRRDTEARIEAEIGRARRELEREVVVAATLAAEKLLRDKATSADHAQLVEQFLGTLGEGSGPAKPSPAKPTSTDEGW